MNGYSLGSGNLGCDQGSDTLVWQADMNESRPYHLPAVQLRIIRETRPHIHRFSNEGSICRSVSKIKGTKEEC